MVLSRSFSRGPFWAVPLMVVVCFSLGIAGAEPAAAAADSSAPGSAQAPAATAQASAPATPAPVAAASTPSFPALPSLLADYHGLHGGSSYDAAGKELRIGHLRLVFTSGTLTAVQTATGREAGFVFDGQGHYDYTTADPADQQSFTKNIMKFANTPSYKDGTLGEEMKGCILVSTQPILDDVLGAGAKPAAGGGGDVTSRIAAFVAADDEADLGVDHPGALAALAASPGRIVTVSIDGKSVDPEYVYDPLVLREERLRLFRTVQGDRFYDVVS